MERLTTNILAIVLTFFLFQCNNQYDYSEDANNGALFLIEKNNKLGFIDSKGNTVIEPIFRNLGDFVNGLAPARVNGTYGYINPKGEFKIPQKFDFAEDFNEGLARVWVNGNISFIDTNGIIVIDAKAYKSADDFEKGRSVVRTLSDKAGLIDLNGSLILDTVYSSIHYLNNGLFVVYGPNCSVYGPLRDRKNEVGIIDSTGKWIVEYGTFVEVNPFHEGYAEASISSHDDDWGGVDVLIDTSGSIVFKLPFRISFALDHFFSNGLIGVSEAIQDSSKEYSNIQFCNLPNYTSFYNLKGERVIDESTIEYANVFNEGRTFAGTYYKWKLINRNGEILNNDTYTEVGEFQDGLAVVCLENSKWGVIDTNGVFIIEPRYDKISEYGFVNGLLPVGMIASNNSSRSNENVKAVKWGFIDKEGNFITECKFDQFDVSGFRDGLLYVVEGSHHGYINHKSQYVWKEELPNKDNRESLETLNIDFMLSGYFYASSHSDDSDYHKSLKQESQIIELPDYIDLNKLDNDFGLRVFENHLDTFAMKFAGVKAIIYNLTEDTVYLNAQDGRLYAQVQALDLDGNWMDIEYLPDSWCGHSYHHLELPPNKFWEFTAPLYQGDYKTLLRIKFIPSELVDGRLQICENENDFLYSNTYFGGVNPAQFWRKYGYRPLNIMDPYLE